MERITSSRSRHMQSIIEIHKREIEMKQNLVYIKKRLSRISQKWKRCRPSDSKFREHSVVRNPMP